MPDLRRGWFLDHAPGIANGTAVVGDTIIGDGVSGGGSGTAFLDSQEPPDKALWAIDLNGGFGTGPPGTNSGWDHENDVTSFGAVRLPVFGGQEIDLPTYGSFSVRVHTHWHFTFGIGQPKLIILVQGLDGGDFITKTAPYTGGVTLGFDEGYGGGGYLSNQEVTLFIPRRTIRVTPKVLGVAVDLDNKTIWGRVDGVWSGIGGNPATNTGGGDISLVVSGSVYPAWSNYAGSQATLDGSSSVVGPVPAGFSVWGATTWDAGNLGANLTLSNNGLTVAGTAANAWTSVRASLGHSSGKWYFELSGDLIDSADGWMGGVENASGTLTSYLGSTGNGAGYQSLGTFYINTGTPGPDALPLTNPQLKLFLQGESDVGGNNNFFMPQNTAEEYFRPASAMVVKWWRT